MSEHKITYDLCFSDVIRVLRLIDETPFRELQLELDGLKLHIVQDIDAPAQRPAAPGGAGTETPALAPDPVHAPATRMPAVTDGTPVVAPLAGIFYRAPFPGEPPFVEAGSIVKQGDVIGIVEIMKLMNHVTAPCPGVVREICARNEQSVEFGQVLAIISALGAA